MFYCCAPHITAPDRTKLFGFGDAAICIGNSKTDPPFGLVFAAARPGNAGDGDGELGGGAIEGPLGHFPSDLFRYGAMRLKRLMGDAQHFLLGGIGIGHKASIKDGRIWCTSPTMQ